MRITKTTSYNVVIGLEARNLDTGEWEFLSNSVHDYDELTGKELKEFHDLNKAQDDNQRLQCVITPTTTYTIVKKEKPLCFT